MRSSLVLTRTLLRFQDTVGSGWPRGGTHSSTAGSPAATTTSLGACRKSSLRTAGKGRRGEIKLGRDTPSVSAQFKQWNGNPSRRSMDRDTRPVQSKQDLFSFFFFLQGCLLAFIRKPYPTATGLGESELMARKRIIVCARAKKIKIKNKSKSLATSDVLVGRRSRF